MLKSTQIHPTKDRVLVEPEQADSEIEGILLPETARKEMQLRGMIPNTGRVLAIGPEYKDTIKVGDRIVFAAYGGTNITTEDKGVIKLLDGNIVWVNLS